MKKQSTNNNSKKMFNFDTLASSVLMFSSSTSVSSSTSPRTLRSLFIAAKTELSAYYKVPHFEYSAQKYKIARKTSLLRTGVLP